MDVTIQPVILTTPERRFDFVGEIANAFTSVAGFRAPLVYCDEHREGAARATRNALTLAGQSGDHVLFLEDDLLVSGEAPAAIVATRFPDTVAVISFCDMREVPEYSPAGLFLRPALGSDGRGWWGNQAVLFHRETVAMCILQDWFAPEVESQPGIRAHAAAYQDEGKNCSDIRVSLLIHLYGRKRREYAVHVPSLFKHVGHTSMCFPGRTMGERETRNWIDDRRRFGVEEVLSLAPDADVVGTHRRAIPRQT